VHNRVVAFTSVCEEDACWIPQYLAEAERLSLPFVMHFDRCSLETKGKVISHHLFVGATFQDVPSKEFNEQHKQEVLNLAQAKGASWAMAWDIDETYQRNTSFLRSLQEGLLEPLADQLQVRWLNLWETPEWVRIDGPFDSPKRVKFYNLQGGRKWVFDHKITNGAKLVGGREPELALIPFVCLHWGLMTHELRKQHKERWDRIYSKALKGDPNPYGIWQYALNPNIQPSLLKHGYF
jgi:hypothetical protein